MERDNELAALRAELEALRAELNKKNNPQILYIAKWESIEGEVEAYRLVVSSIPTPMNSATIGVAVASRNIEGEKCWTLSIYDNAVYLGRTMAVVTVKRHKFLNVEIIRDRIADYFGEQWGAHFGESMRVCPLPESKGGQTATQCDNYDINVANRLLDRYRALEISRNLRRTTTDSEKTLY